MHMIKGHMHICTEQPMLCNLVLLLPIYPILLVPVISY